MNTYFCQEGLETGSNDGSTALNAFQSIWAVFNNTVTPTLVAGDVIICSPTLSGSDITVEISGDDGPVDIAGGDDNPVTFIMDDGTEFGTDGVLTINCNSSEEFVMNSTWILDCNSQRLLFKCTGDSYHTLLRGGGLIIEPMLTSSSMTYHGWGISGDSGEHLMLKNPYLKPGCHNVSSMTLLAANVGGLIELFEPEIDLSGATSWQDGIHKLAGVSSSGGKVLVHGGRVFGQVTTRNLLGSLPNYSGTDRQRYDGEVIFDGILFDGAYSDAQTVFSSMDAPNISPRHRQYIIKGGVNRNDHFIGQLGGYAHFEADRSYPVINAKLADGLGTPISYRMHTYYCSPVKPLYFTPVRKFFDLAAAAKTITVEFLLETTAVTAAPPTKKNIWMDVEYTRSSDNVTVMESTQVQIEAANLDVSTKVWSLGSYGSVDLTGGKYSLSLTTASAIKQYSEIVMTLHVGYKGSASNIITGFVDIDFEIANVLPV